MDALVRINVVLQSQGGSMATKNYPADVLVQTTDVLTACKQIDPNLSAGRMTQTTITDTLTQVQSMQNQINTLEKQLADLRNRRDERLNEMWDAVKRMRSMVKATYGDDSSEYELVGGTRLSERK